MTWRHYARKPTPTGWVYITLAVIDVARAHTWLHTSWSDSPHVGFLAAVPDWIVAAAWVIAGIALLAGRESYRARIVGITATAGLNAAVGVASLINRVLLDGTGVTVSVAVSYLGIAGITICLPRLTDKQTVINGHQGECE